MGRFREILNLFGFHQAAAPPEKDENPAKGRAQDIPVPHLPSHPDFFVAPELKLRDRTARNILVKQYGGQTTPQELPPAAPAARKAKPLTLVVGNSVGHSVREPSVQ